MIRSLAQQLRSEGLLASDETVVVGVSGGPDSMALLHLLLALNQQLGWQLRLHVAHLNHGLRGADADKDAAFVAAAADSLALPFHVESRHIAPPAPSHPGSDDADDVARAGAIEEIGRNERYAFFTRVSLRVGARVVAVGHHADDNAETILFRILRGTGLRGLTGIPRIRPLSPDSDIRLIRPLLYMTRHSLRAHLADAGIAYREDRTNISTEPMRNRIRNVILPTIEDQVNPQVREALIRLSEQAQWVDEYLSETVQRTFESLIISRTDQEMALNCDALARKSRIVQTELVRLAYRSFGLGEQDLSFAHLSAALELIGEAASGKQLQLPRGMTVEKRYQQLVFALPTDEPRETIAPEIAVHLPGTTVLPIRRLQIDCCIEHVTCPEQIIRLRRAGNRMEEYVDFDSVHPPLTVRTRRTGDRFVPLGAPGSKKLSDFLIDAKVDPRDRERVAVLCDQLGPIWIIGHRIDDRVKLTELTRQVLHLRASPLDP